MKVIQQHFDAHWATVLMTFVIIFVQPNVNAVETSIKDVEAENIEMAQQDRLKNKARLVDPTRPASLKIGQKDQSDQSNDSQNLTPVLTLQAIKISHTARLAVINGQKLKAGDRVASATLLSIQQNAVFLDYEGESIKLSLLPDSVKKRSMK